VAGVMIRHFFNLKNTGRIMIGYPIGAVFVLIALIAWMAPAPSTAPKGAAGVPYVKVKAVMDARCVSCHAVKPTQVGFNEAPKGVVLETKDQVKARAAQIYQQVVVAKAMPIANLTQMTDEERALLGAWVTQGARTD